MILINILKILSKVNILQPENKIYQDFLIILQAMLIFNENMENFETIEEPSEDTGSPKSSISFGSQTELSFEADVIENELVNLTEQLQVQETEVVTIPTVTSVTIHSHQNDRKLSSDQQQNRNLTPKPPHHHSRSPGPNKNKKKLN